MRVLHVYQDFFPSRGGIEDFLLALASESNSHGDDHSVLTAGAFGRTTIDEVAGIRVVRAATLGRWFTPLCPTWPRLVQRTGADVLHVHLPCPMAELTALAVRRSRVHVVVTIHNDYVRPRVAVGAWRPVHLAALRGADRIVTTTHDYADSSPAIRSLVSADGRRKSIEDRLVVIPLGIDPREYARRDEKKVREVRARYPVPLVVFLGRLCYYKGLDVLIEAAALMRQRAIVLVIGGGPCRRGLTRQAAALSPESPARVDLAGPLSELDVVAHLHAADLFVLPSTERSEAFGLAQLKAMACGVPVVTTDLPGVAWVNRDRETGLVVPRRDPRALAAALDSLLADEEWRGRLSAGARERAGQFTISRMANAYCEVYSELASPRST